MDRLLQQGASNAVRACMNVQPGERVFILTDRETLPIARALEAEAQAAGAAVMCVPLDEIGARPMTEFPQALGEMIVSFAPTLSFYAATVRENELPLRTGMVRLVLGELGARHAHMPGVTLQMMREGMSADYAAVNQITQRVAQVARRAQSIRVTAPDGTDLRAGFSGAQRWAALGGLYHQPRTFGNLPEGEVCTCPDEVEGNFVTYVLGDYFSEKYGVLASPLRIEIADSRVTRIQGERQDIADELLAYLDSAENGRRVGEFAIGTNTSVTALCGSLLQDEKIPGVHIAFGDPLAHLTGADWASKIHVDVVNPRCSIEVDGAPLMVLGQFVIG